MLVGIPKETYPEERRVAVVPSAVPALIKAGVEVCIQAGAGEAAGYLDTAYLEAGAKVEASREELFRKADVLLQVRALGANPLDGHSDLERTRSGQVVIGMFEPFTALEEAKQLAAKGATVFAMELVPRITRAQSMDALSSMATIAGYKAVIHAADILPKMYPMMMTAAGTISPAKVLVLGVGVAGLQAIATAKRLGAVVSAYDIRAAVKEQVESVGAKFVELDLETGDAEDKGGYAKGLGADQLKRQQDQLAKVIADNDVIITTAAVPGRKAPILITEEMMESMPSGSIIINLAAERGGNCALTEEGKSIVVKNGVRVVGLVNVASALPFHASQMYSKNITTFLKLILKDGNLNLDTEDEVIAGMMVCHDGAVVHPQIKEIIAGPSAAGAKKEN